MVDAVAVQHDNFGCGEHIPRSCSSQVRRDGLEVTLRVAVKKRRHHHSAQPHHMALHWMSPTRTRE